MTVGITVRDGTAYLDVTDPEVWEAIIEATSFKPANAAYAQKNKPTRLVRNNKAPVGLLDRVCRAVGAAGDDIQLTWVYQDVDKPVLYGIDLYNVEPRGYQKEAHLAAQLNDRGIFRVPTGGGKTLLACQIIAAKNRQAVVIVPTIDLLIQTRDYLREHLSGAYATPWEKIGQLGDGVVDPHPITVATIRTMAKVLDVAYETYEYAEYDDTDNTDVDRRMLRGWVDSLGTVIVDEAHQLGARVLYQTVTAIPAPYKFGLSASPWRDDGADLMIEAATGPPVFYVPAGRLVKEGYLMAPHIRVIDTSKWWTAAAWGQTCKRCHRQWLRWTKECTCGCTQFQSQFNDSYRNEIVENPVRNTRIAQEVAALVQSGRSVLVLVKQVKHGKLLTDTLPNAVFLSGRNKGEDRHAVFDAVRAGLQRVIVCTTIGDMGLDIPDLGALVLAGGGKSSTRHLQRIGRVVRPVPGKPRPIVLDFDDSHIHSWYANHLHARRAIEKAEWGDTATWSYE